MLSTGGSRKCRNRIKRLNRCHYGPTNTYTIQSPIGDLIVVSCPKGLHSLGQAKEISDENFAPDLWWLLSVVVRPSYFPDFYCESHSDSAARLNTYRSNGKITDTYTNLPYCASTGFPYISAILKECPRTHDRHSVRQSPQLMVNPFLYVLSLRLMKWIRCWFAGSFQKRVWEMLTKCVPPGKTISYGSLGNLVDGENTSVARAVGTAMRKNPLQIIVPCHRVIKADGSLGHYKGGKGNSIKKWLLKHEGFIG